MFLVFVKIIDFCPVGDLRFAFEGDCCVPGLRQKSLISIQCVTFVLQSGVTVVFVDLYRVRDFVLHLIFRVIVCCVPSLRVSHTVLSLSKIARAVLWMESCCWWFFSSGRL